MEWERRRLGRTGLEVTVLGLGGAWLGHRAGTYDPETGVRTVLAALEAGIRLIDTSGGYIGGRSEQFIGEALDQWYRSGGKRSDLVICTKTGTRVWPHDYTYDGTMRSVETSLAALRTDHLDIVLVHDPSDMDPALAPGGAVTALKKLRQAGVLRSIGLGCRPHAFHRRFIETGECEVCLTFEDFNVIDRTAEEGVLVPAMRHDVGVLNASIMLSGLLGGEDPLLVEARRAAPGAQAARPSERAMRARRMWDWCREREVDLGTLNLQYCVRDRRFAAVLLGFSNPARVAQDVAAAGEKLDAEVWPDLDRLLACSPPG